MVSLRQFATDQTGTFGNAEHPASLRGKEALKMARVAKAVDLLVEHPAPTVVTLASELGVSRATVYRMLAEDGFQVLLRKVLLGRIGLVAKKAMDQVEKALEDGSPALRFKAATWLLERQEKMQQLSNSVSERFEQDKALARLREMRERIRRDREAGLPLNAGSTAETGAPPGPAWAAREDRGADAELEDAELLDRSGEG